MAKHWPDLWAQGVQRAQTSPRRDGKDYRPVPGHDRSQGTVSVIDPRWVRAVRDALMADVPSRAFELWRQEGWLRHGLPEIDRLWGIPQPPQYHPEVDTGVHAMMVIDQAAAQGYSERARWAALAHDFGKSLTPPAKWPAHHGHEEAGVPLVKERLGAWGLPPDVIALAVAVTRHHGAVHRIGSLRAPTVLDIVDDARLEQNEAWLRDFGHGVEADDRGRLGFFEHPGRSTEALATVVRGLREDQDLLLLDREATWAKRLARRADVEATGRRLTPLTPEDRRNFEQDYQRQHRVASVKRALSAWKAGQGLPDGMDIPTVSTRPPRLA